MSIKAGMDKQNMAYHTTFINNISTILIRVTMTNLENIMSSTRRQPQNIAHLMFYLLEVFSKRQIYRDRKEISACLRLEGSRTDTNVNDPHYLLEQCECSPFCFG